jgi:hypothetical protein
MYTLLVRKDRIANVVVVARMQKANDPHLTRDTEERAILGFLLKNLSLVLWRNIPNRKSHQEASFVEDPG